MFDVLITGGILADGTGSAPRRADVGIVGDRIVSVSDTGRAPEGAHRTIDAGGLTVTPGFVDIHTHIDGQVLWDPTLDPLPLYGITTAVGGNCGFTLAPITEADVDYISRMFSRVEDIPLESLEAGLAWNWSSTGEYLDEVARHEPSINVGFLVGHSTLRRKVMGDRAVGSAATAEDIAAMTDLLRESIRGGGLGLSTSMHGGQVDGDGNPIPSRFAGDDEFIALCEATGNFPGTSLQLASNTRLRYRFDEAGVALLARMTAVANRSINWNVFVPDADDEESSRGQLALSDKVARLGGQLYALAYPGVMSVRRTCFGGRYFEIPGWAEFVALPLEEKAAVLADPAQRGHYKDLADRARKEGKDRHHLTHWDELIIAEGFTEQTRTYEGRTVGEVAREQDRDPFDVLCDIAVADGMRTGLVPPLKAADEGSWKLRAETWQDDRVILGASDTGAHVQSMATFDWAIDFLYENRKRQLITFEAAVRKVTEAPASLYGLRDRGVIREGAYADVLVFDPEELAPGQVRTRQDLPGGASRLYGSPAGLRHVFVNGHETVSDGSLSEVRRGRVLRSGTDTVTVGLPAPAHDCPARES